MFKFFIAVVVATTPMAARAQDTGVAQQVLSDTGASYPTSFSGPSKQEEPVGTLVDLRSTRASRAVLPESLVPGVRPDGTLRGLPGGFSVVVDDVTSSIPIRFHLTSFEASNLGGWTIAGRTTESPTDVFVMSRFEDSVSGYIEARHGAWEFEGSAGREGIALRRVEGDAGDACESRVDEAESKGSLDLGFGLHECSLDAGEDVDWVSIESFGVSMMSALGGPWQGFDGVLDLMFVYDPSILGSAPGFPTTASGLNANIMTAVANVQAAFAASGINWGVRIVSIKSTPWSYASGLSPQREQLRLTSDGHVDSVHAWRNDAGADIVVGIVPEDGGGAHGNSSVPLDHLASNESTAFLVVEADALLGLNSLAHELGHQAGNGHEHISGCGADLNIADYACGYTFPSTLLPQCACSPTASIPGGGGACCDPSGNAPGCVDVGQFEDLMASGPSTRRLFYADPGLTWTDGPGPDGVECSCDDRCGSTPRGTNVPAPVTQYKANAALRFSEGLPVLSEYRMEVAQTGGAAISTPPAGSNLSSSTVTFSWSPVSGATGYWLEVGGPAANPFFSQAVTGTSQVVTGVSTTTPILGRLWTNFGGNWWTWREYRYNVTGRLIGCNEDAAWLVPAMDPLVAGSDCFSDFTFPPSPVFPFCTFDAVSGELVCDVDDGGSAGVVVTASNSTSGWQRLYDVVVWGTSNHAPTQKFCCQLSDRGADLETVVVHGSPNSDTVAFSVSALPGASGPDLCDYDGTGFRAEARTLGGADTIFGSNCTHFSYDEWLYGQRGPDTIHGGSGLDHLIGGKEADDLFGGPGTDYLIGEGPGTDEMFGQTGWDFLCSGEKHHLMLGSDVANAAESTAIYVSPGATGSFNPGTKPNTTFAACGHTSYGTGWGQCGTGNYTLSTAPGDCFGLVP